ncbi:MAG: C1 family peptidase [Bacteroidales bacterium]|nr:C1 family peptidase [Bacteroidales bacterium]MDD4215943.1 C1 family peptidase [Bacteroidales bacterium]MDY0141041.1 C1 family peptidase [Bacteroidales bacterium]
MIKNLIITSLLFLVFSITLSAQTGNLDEQSLKNFRDAYSKTSESNKGIRNALTNNDVRKLSVNRDVTGKTDHDFKYKVKVSGITNQESSGRCWMFTGLNSLRPEIIANKELSSFEFSVNHSYFWDLLEKSNLFLEAVMQNSDKDFTDKTIEWLFKNPIGDGGVWNSFANIVRKYGAVPKTVMPETYHSENSAWLNRILSRKLRENGLKLYNLKRINSSTKQIADVKFAMMSEIYKTLVLFLGEPPTEFEYRFVDKSGKIGEYKTYTPQSFFTEMFPDFNVGDYVMLMNDPTREYYKVYEIEFDRNVLEGQNWIYLNLPSDEIKKFAIESIKNNEAMYASCDVGKQLNKEDGTLNINNYDFEALLGIEFRMDKSERIKTYDSGSSHAMLLMAVDTDDEDKPFKWQFENSWGTLHGHNGYLTFTDDWFNEYMFRLVVNKKYIDAKTLKLTEQKPIMLPPWDPMFMQDF